nr:MAG TPA: hypothetical protein [Caudoviricetes sp.]
MHVKCMVDGLIPRYRLLFSILRLFLSFLTTQYRLDVTPRM